MSIRHARVREAQKALKGLAVAAIKRTLFAYLVISGMAFTPIILAAVLPDDRADALFHSYDGGGITVNGPSLLLQKSLGAAFSFSGNYYIDSISSASIDVITSASPYKEERTEKSLGMTYIHDKSTLQLSLTESTESDFDANSASFNISQDFFGDLTTLSLGYSLGNNTVRMSTNTAFSADADSQSFRLGLSQVVTKNMFINSAIETITDEGFLNNPYRSVRYIDSTSPLGYSFEPEIYPRTRTSSSVSIGGQYYLPYRASIGLEYRYFNDSWDIQAHTFSTTYTQPLRKDRWLIDVEYRFYTQTKASFYNDLFPFQQAQNFLARDKELSSFNNHSIGINLEYKINTDRLSWLKKGQVAGSYRYMMFNYDNFRNLSQIGTAGQEPLYSFNASVLQLYFSIWF